MIDLVVALAESDCERLHAGWLAQPANAVSSLAYVAVGLWLLWRSRRGRTRRSQRAALSVGGTAMAAVGLGSFAYHGPQPGWADLLHNGSIMALVAVLAAETAVLVRAGAWRAAVPAGKAAAAWMALAVPAHLVGRSGSALCHPAAPWQPHAAWHLLSAVALGFVVLACSARSHDRRPEVTPRGFPEARL